MASIRVRRLTAMAAVAGLLTVATGLPAQAAEPRATEKQSRSLANDERKQRGIKTLKWDKSLIKKARANSKKMADNGYLSHSDLANVLKGKSWSMAGENVVYATTVKKAHNKLMASKAHKANILNGGFAKVAIGVIKRDGYVWITQIFYG